MTRSSLGASRRILSNSLSPGFLLGNRQLNSKVRCSYCAINRFFYTSNTSTTTGGDIGNRFYSCSTSSNTTDISSSSSHTINTSPGAVPHLSPDAEVSFDEDDDNKDRFIRFSPLPTKWARTRRSTNRISSSHKGSLDEVYTGRPKNTIPPISYYTDIVSTLNNLDDSENTITNTNTKRTMNERFLVGEDYGQTAACFIGPECCRTTLISGDMIEISSRDGQTIFGVVLKSDFRKVSILTIEGNMIEIGKHRWPSSSIILRGYFSEHVNQAPVNYIMKHMKLFIKMSLGLMTKISPYLQPVYAYLAQPSTLRATNITQIVNKALSAASSNRSILSTGGRCTSGRYPINDSVNAQRGLPLEIAFAAYLSACGNNLRFARLSSDSPITAVSEQSFDAIVKIMHYLTDQELTSYVQIFRQLLSSSNEISIYNELTTNKSNNNNQNTSLEETGASSEINFESDSLSSVEFLKRSSDPVDNQSSNIISRTPTGLAPILAFFRHYIVCPDPRLADAIRAVLSRVYPERDSDVWLSAPSTVHKLLCDSGLADPNNPYLIPSSVAWPENNPNRALTNNLGDKFEIERNKKRISSRSKLVTKIANNRLNWQYLLRGKVLPIFRFTGSDDIAFSMDLESHQSNFWTLYIHVPDLASSIMPNEAAVKTLFQIGKSFKTLDHGNLDLFPSSYRDKLGFPDHHSNIQTEASHRSSTNCLTFSIKLPSHDPAADWHEEDCNVFLTTIPSKCQILINPAIQSIETLRDTGLSRQDFHSFTNIKSVFEKIFWRRVENGAIFDTPISSRPYEPKGLDRDQSFSQNVRSAPLSSSSLFSNSDIVQEARLTAGRIAALFSKKCKIPFVPFMNQSSLLLEDVSSYEREARSYYDLTRERRLVGTINAADRVLAERYFGAERISNEPLPYGGLGIADGYVHIANPFEDTMSLCSQWAIQAYLAYVALKADLDLDKDNVNDKKDYADKTMFLRQMGIQYGFSGFSSKFIESEVLPQRDLVSYFHDRLNRFKSLQQLEEELRSSRNYFIFRCRVIAEAQFPEMAVAYCHELQLSVDIALLPNTSVAAGDTVICTEIIELNPVDGLLVLGL